MMAMSKNIKKPYLESSFAQKLKDLREKKLDRYTLRGKEFGSFSLLWQLLSIAEVILIF